VRARLFALVDDHSRLLVAGRWIGNETLGAGQEVLHAAILRRGLPAELYVDYADLRVTTASIRAARRG